MVQEKQGPRGVTLPALQGVDPSNVRQEYVMVVHDEESLCFYCLGDGEAFEEYLNVLGFDG